MKPTQEQVIAWARDVGFSEYHLRVLDQGIYRLADLAYEAGRKDENEACAKEAETVYGKQDIESKYAGLVGSVLMDVTAAIRTRREQ